jgi:hypothetical protein
MADLLTLATLARWTQNDADEVAADPFAQDVITKVSQLVCFLGGHDGTVLDADGELIPEWTLELGPEQAPIDVQMVVLKVCKRSYENPEQIIQAGSIGPLGGDRVADVQALFMDFTEQERATITRYNPNGDPSPTEDAGTIFTIATTRGDETTLPQTSPLYMGDDQQINLASSPDPREWKIPMFNPGDPGDDSNYES